jgi:hypothetical protein
VSTPPAGLYDTAMLAFVPCPHAYSRPAPATAPLLALNVAVNGTNPGTPPLRQHCTTTVSVPPDGPHFCAWHQANRSVTAVACTTPPVMPIPANLTIACPGLPGLATGGGDGTLSAQCPAAAARAH